MREALLLARMAAAEGEVPVGCVIVRDGEIVGRGRNQREKEGSALAHAEMLAIAEANRALHDFRLSDCSLFVTLEPCPMCAGAILNARLGQVIYGAKDPAMGACGSVLNLFEENFGYHPPVYGGVLAEECAGLLREFFKNIRR